MVCVVWTFETPKLRDPILIEGLPGIGFVANIAALHLIQELKAKRFAAVHSSSFQDFAISTDDGKPRFPLNELYYYKGKKRERDLIILYGNTQALTAPGQYELCGRILDVAKELGCRYVMTLGGLRRVEPVDTPKIYCAASDAEALKEALNIGAEIMDGRIFGIAGLLIGLGALRNMHGLCLLAETPGVYPDAKAAREALRAASKVLDLTLDLGKLDAAVEATHDILKSFGIVARPTEEKQEEHGFEGLI